MAVNWKLAFLLAFSTCWCCCVIPDAAYSGIYVMQMQPSRDDQTNPIMVVNTWPFVNATKAAFAALSAAPSVTALDAVEIGCLQAEADQSLDSVSYGYHPDETGNVTFDAMLMNGDTMEAGSVAAMPDILEAISVARAVMERTRHTMLVGERATEFAVEMGFKRRSLNTQRSTDDWQSWRAANCQPNYRRNVSPPPDRSCGPYKPLPPPVPSSDTDEKWPRREGHDTIGMIAVDSRGSLAVGTTTNAAWHRVPGRVGDTPIVGAGGYADSLVGAAVGTGDGDILMRYLLSFAAVRGMAVGLPPDAACQSALAAVRPPPGGFQGALVAVNRTGGVGGACVGFDSFQISLLQEGMAGPQLIDVPCKKSLGSRL